LEKQGIIAIIHLVMEKEIPHSADHSPVDKRPIAQGLEELRTVLGDLTRLALTSGSDVMKLTREDFQSQTYQQAGYGAMPFGITPRPVSGTLLCKQDSPRVACIGCGKRWSADTSIPSRGCGKPQRVAGGSSASSLPSSIILG
jgi:hypothetical protein